MKCPKYVAAMLAAGGPVDDVEALCDREECAWWLADIQMCSVRDIALELQHTQFRLQDLVTKMPHEN